MINCNLYSAPKIKRYVLAFLLAIFLPALPVFGQGSLHSGTSLKKDTVLMEQYIQASKKGSLSSDSSLKLLNKALILTKAHGLQRKTGFIWGFMAGKELQQGNFEHCKLYLDSAFRLNEQLKDGELTCILNTAAAGMYQYSGNYAKAASHYFRALEAIREYKIENVRPAVIVYTNLSGLMTLLQEDSLSRVYMLQAKQHALNMRPVDSGLLTIVMVGLAQTYVRLDSSAAINHLKDAYKLAKRSHDITFSYSALINLTQSYIAQKQYDSAELYLKLAKQLAEPGVSLIRAETVEGILSFCKKDYAVAIKHLQTALDLTHGEDYDNLDQIYETFSDVYAARGEYQKAYEFHKKFMEQYKKIMGNPQRTVADFMLNFQSLEHEKRIMEKQAEITAQEASIKKRNLWIIAMCVFSALICVILVMAYRNYHHRRVLLNERMNALVQHQEIERLKAEAEGADKERTRIAYDLHDGVMVRLAHVKMNLNALPAVLPGFAEDKRYLDMIEQLDVTTRELRNTAHNLMPEILLEDGIAQAIFYFCKATEQASGLTIKFQQVGVALPRLQTQVEIAVYRIVQGLVQNIIRHAKATTALVQLQYTDHLFAVTIEDNGSGISDLKNAEGYGLKSIRNRIKVLSGTFDIESESGHGTTAYIEFDVRPFL